MNGRAAAKAVGVYLAILVPVGAWIGGMIWVGATGQNGLLANLIAGAPLVIILGALFAGLTVVMPVLSMYDHYNRKGGK